jgi:DHH family
VERNRDELTPKQQAAEAIRQAETVLIVTGRQPSADQVASVLALAMILHKIGKKVTPLISDNLPGSLNFLPLNMVDRSLSGLRDFVIQVNLGQSEVDKLKYTVENGKLNINITPFRGGFSPQDVNFAYGDYHYDLAIVIGVPQRAKIDRALSDNPQLFGSVPVVNIDFHRVNEQYGAINLIDPSAASLSEMLVALAESLQTGLLDEPLATALLTGIMSSTDRFTAPHTTPKALTVAAQMMAAGAKQQQVVKALWNKNNRDAARAPERDRSREAAPAPQPQPKSEPTPVTPPVPQPTPQPEAPSIVLPTEPSAATLPAEPAYLPALQADPWSNPTTAAEQVEPAPAEQSPTPEQPELPQPAPAPAPQSPTAPNYQVDNPNPYV